jgi:hypothetical protein
MDIIPSQGLPYGKGMAMPKPRVYHAKREAIDAVKPQLLHCHVELLSTEHRATSLHHKL